MSDETRLADAIELIHRCTIYVQDAPGPGCNQGELEAHALALRTTGGLELRQFQRVGISSRDVASALRKGILGCWVVGHDD